MAVGVEVTGLWRQAGNGNRRILHRDENRKIQADKYASMKVEMLFAGAEEFVVVMKLL